MAAQDLVTNLLDSADPDAIDPQAYLDRVPSSWVVFLSDPVWREDIETRRDLMDYYSIQGYFVDEFEQAQLFPSKETAEQTLRDYLLRRGEPDLYPENFYGVLEVSHFMKESSDPDAINPQHYLDAVHQKWAVVYTRPGDPDPYYQIEPYGEGGVGDFIQTAPTGARLHASKESAEQARKAFLDSVAWDVHALPADQISVEEIAGQVDAETERVLLYRAELDRDELDESADPDDVDPRRYLDEVPHKWAVVYEDPVTVRQYLKAFTDEWSIGGRDATLFPSKEQADFALERYITNYHAEDRPDTVEYYGVREMTDLLGESADPDAIDPQRYLADVPAGYIIAWTNKDGIEWVYQNYNSFAGGSGARVNAMVFPSRQAAQELLQARGLEGYDILPYTPRARGVVESADPDDPQALLSRMRGRWAVQTTVAGRPHYVKVITLTDRQRAKRVQMGKPDYRWLYDWVVDIKRASLFTSKDAAEAVLNRMQEVNSTAGKYRSVQDVSGLLGESADPDEIGDPMEYMRKATIPSLVVSPYGLRKLLKENGYQVISVYRTKQYDGLNATVWLREHYGRDTEMVEQHARFLVQRWVREQFGSELPAGTYVLVRADEAKGTMSIHIVYRGVNEAVDPDDIADPHHYIAGAVEPLEQITTKEIRLLMRSLGFKVVYARKTKKFPGISLFVQDATGRSLDWQDEKLVSNAIHEWLKKRLGNKPGTIRGYEYAHDYQINIWAWDGMETDVATGTPRRVRKPGLSIDIYKPAEGQSLYATHYLESADPDAINPKEYLDDVAPSLEHLMQQHGFEMGRNTDRYYKSYLLSDGRYFIVSAEDNGMQPKSSEPDAPVLQTYWVQVRTRDCPHDSFRNMNWTELAFAQADDDSLTGLVEFAEEMGQTLSEHPGEVTDSEMQSLFVDAGWDYTVRLGESLDDPDDPAAFFKRNEGFRPIHQEGSHIIKWVSFHNPVVIYSEDYKGRTHFSISDSGPSAHASVAQVKEGLAFVIQKQGLQRVSFTVFNVDRDIDAIYGLEADGVIETTGQDGALVFALVEEPGAVAESLEPVMEMGGAVNIWLSPAGKPYYCADHAEWAASEVLKKPLSKMTGTYWEARGYVYRQMFRRGWARLALPHNQKKLMVDSHRTTPAQWEWIYDKGWEDRLQIVDDQEQTIIDYREGSGVEPPKGEETGTWEESLQVPDPDDPDQNMRRALDVSDPQNIARRLTEAGYALQGMQGGSDEQFYTKAIKRGVRVSVFLSEAFVSHGSMEGYAEHRADWGVAVTLNWARSTVGLVYPQPFRLMEAVAEMEALALTIRGIDLEHETEQRLEAAIDDMRRRYMGDLAESADPDDPDQFIERMPVPHYIVRGRDAAHHDWRYVNRGLFLTTDPSRATSYSAHAAQQVVDRFKGRVGELEIVPIQESVDPDAPEHYVQSIGGDFGAWLEIQGLTKSSDAVVDDFAIEGYMEGAPRSLRVIYFKDGVDYRSNPRGPWLWLLLGTTAQGEGSEEQVRPVVERFLSRMRTLDDYSSAEADDYFDDIAPDEHAVEEAMVEVLLTEAGPDEFDPELYLHQTTNTREAMRMLGMFGGKGWPKDTMERCSKTYLLDQPVEHKFGPPGQQFAKLMTGVVVYDFGGRQNVHGNIELAAGILFDDGTNAPQISMDVNDDSQTAALARIIQSLDRFFASYSTKGKDWKAVYPEIMDALKAARHAQYSRRMRESEEPHTISAAVRQGKDYYAPTMSPTLKVKFNVTPHPNRKGSGRSGWHKKRKLPPMPPKMESIEPFKQPDEVTCGSSVVYMLSRSMGKLNADFQQVCQMCRTNRLWGTLPMFMSSALRKLGIAHTKTKVTSAAQLDGVYALLTVYEHLPHWILVTGQLDGQFTVNDPAQGAVVYNAETIDALLDKSQLSGVYKMVGFMIGTAFRIECPVQESTDPDAFDPKKELLKLGQRCTKCGGETASSGFYRWDQSGTLMQAYRCAACNWTFSAPSPEGSSNVPVARHAGGEVAESADPDDPDACLKNYHPMEFIVKAQVPDGPRYITRHSWDNTFKTKAAVERWLQEATARGYDSASYLYPPNRVVLEEWVVPTHKLDAYLEKAWEWFGHGGHFIDITDKYPCPFCGGEPHPVDRDSKHLRYCTRCERTWFLGKPERFGMSEAVDPDEPTPEAILRLGRPGACSEPCRICGQFCTLNHFQTRGGAMVPDYHICLYCDMKSMKGEGE